MRTRIKLHIYIVSDTNKRFKFDLGRKLNPHGDELLNPGLKFLDMVTKRQNRKDHIISAIFVIYSIFSNRNQIGHFSRKAYDKLLTMTAKNSGVPVFVGEL